MVATYLSIIGDRVALAWVLTHSRMAFPSTPRLEVSALEMGDELFLVSTRGCFRNPTRDRTRIIGHAVLASAVTRVEDPIELIGRTFDRACDLEVMSLAPVLTGVALAPLVDQLQAFPNKEAWSVWLRRPLLRLHATDADLVRPRIGEVAVDPDLVLQGYIDLGRESLVR